MKNNKNTKILIMGLSGAGKSELAKELHSLFQNDNKSSVRINGDEVREINNDWDFSISGRIRQVKRMVKLVKKSTADYIIVDFIAPTELIRNIFNPDILIWVDTVISSKYVDTDTIFESPKNYDFKVIKKDAKKEALKIYKYMTIVTK